MTSTDIKVMKNLLKTFVCNVALHGSETWMIRPKGKNYLHSRYGTTEKF